MLLSIFRYNKIIMGETNVDGQQPPTKKAKPEPTVLEQEFDKEFFRIINTLEEYT